ncbi:unnamed protein product [marine sediment metagenome]|uniref:DNA polymerase beta thumb domain-containing protein n=1 Tax=marine sediment metagenome TaxID=412755 RepID=X1QFA1_9ZZZZ
MLLAEALRVADEVYHRLKPHCGKIVVAGSIRRQKDEIRDIDIVLIPANPGQLSQEIDRLGPPMKDGQKLRRVNYKGAQVDIYYASPQTWATLLLIPAAAFVRPLALLSGVRADPHFTPSPRAPDRADPVSGRPAPQTLSESAARPCQ